MRSLEEAISLIRGEKVDIVTLVFTDILGRLKGFNLSVAEIERAFHEGIVFDGSSVEGFVRIEESDLIAKPDPNSIFIAPESVSGLRTAYVVCDILSPNGQPFVRDPRGILKSRLIELGNEGYSYFVGPELEYFYFASSEAPELLDEAGYFDLLPSYRPTLAREETVKILREMGIEVEASHHEVAPSQHEVDFRYADALRAADVLQISKMIIKEIGRKHGLYASFMPKPIFGVNGNGLHLHMSIWKDGENLFYNGDHEYQLSRFAQHFLAGILKNIRYITLVLNQWVNSYKRLVVGYEAPVYISWGRSNRSALVRVPAFKKPSSSRIELRSPDPGTNPYLAFASILEAGFRGVAERTPLPPPVEQDIYHMSAGKRRRLKIGSLPSSLKEAIELAQRSDLLKRAIGEPMFSKLVENKLVEWDKFRTAVTDHEIKTYFGML
ncbi:MAG: glutamine synthetase [Thermotogae bacterium]|nr:glutamine synthetase [Thermotogota bacterium]